MDQSTSKPRALAARLYALIWRWHFWAGLLVAPVLIVVSLTGALYVFAPEIRRAMDSEHYWVATEPGTETVRFDALKATIETDQPGYTVHLIFIDPDPTRAWEIFAEANDPSNPVEHLYLTANPYTGEILSIRSEFGGFLGTILDLHRTLLVGLPGRLVVEVATCWGIVSVLTGLWLWWPRKKEKLWGVWLPRIKGGMRTILRDWHTVPGVYLSLIVLAVMVTGLLFTRVWGTAWLAGNALTGGFPEFYVNPPQSTLPEAGEPTLISLDDAYAAALEQFDFTAVPHHIHAPRAGETEAVEVATEITNPLQPMGFVFFDAYSGALLNFTSSADFPLRTWLTLYFYPIHVGSLFGLPTKILAVLACLILIAMSVTGMWMWWRRRAPGTFGAPRKPKDATAPKWITGLTLGLAVFLPTVGLTLVALGLIRGGRSLAARCLQSV